MRTHRLRPILVLAIACAPAILLFLLDLAFPDAPFWGRFLLPIVIVFLWGRRRDIYIATAFASILVLATYWQHSPSPPVDFLINHLLLQP